MGGGASGVPVLIFKNGIEENAQKQEYRNDTVHMQKSDIDMAQIVRFYQKMFRLKIWGC
jgi:hypothetical protein